MNREELIGIVEDILDECESIFSDRNESYAEDGDALSNFVKFADIATIHGFSFAGRPVTPEAVAFWMALFKAERWGTKMAKKEDPSDSRRDLINYTILGEACSLER